MQEQQKSVEKQFQHIKYFILKEEKKQIQLINEGAFLLYY